MRRRRVVRRLALTTALIAVVGALVAGPAAAAPPPKLKSPATTGRRLTDEFLGILQQRDTAALAKFLDPAFQLQRADGTGVDKAQYVANPAVVGQYQLGDTVTATQNGDVLVVRWSVKSDLTVDGQQYAGAEAPRISTYHWTGTRWQLVAHANFNRPA